MSTRSTISIHRKDGQIYSVYCHWDGYYEHNGVILYNFYDTPEKVNKLISYGDISSLGTEIGKKHNFNDLYYGCTFYHRDRKEEKNIQIMNVYSDVNPYYYLNEEEFNYIFIEETNEWIAKKEGASKWQKLEEVFKKMSFSDWVIPVADKRQFEKMINFYTKFAKNMKIPNIEEVLYEI